MIIPTPILEAVFSIHAIQLFDLSNHVFCFFIVLLQLLDHRPKATETLKKYKQKIKSKKKVSS